mmetsp:Transcript_30639/g.35352  ORF Transcript_30639/g.35352 Transcript_30639/m.35352 type:complete len:94 (+) Transcript_30639:451-732(+)
MDTFRVIVPTRERTVVQEARPATTVAKKATFLVIARTRRLAKDIKHMLGCLHNYFMLQCELMANRHNFCVRHVVIYILVSSKVQPGAKLLCSG